MNITVEQTILKEKWSKVSLFQILETLENGSRPKGGIKKITDGIPSIGGEHLSDDGRFKFENLRLVSKDFYSSLRRGKIEPKDVLVVKDGATTGKTSFVGNDFPFKEAAVNEHVFILRGKKELIDQKFLYYHLRSRKGQKQIDANFHGAAIGGINTQFTKNYFLSLPSIDTQRQLVSILEKSEHLQQWRKESYKLTNYYLNSVFQKMFGHLMSWKIVELNTICSKITDGEHNVPPRIKTGIPLLMARNVQDGYIDMKNIAFISEEHHKKAKLRCNPQEGDILLSCIGTIGRAAIVTKMEPFSLVRNVAILKLKKEHVTSEYILTCLRTKFIQTQILSRKHASTQAALYLNEIEKLGIPLPPLYLQAQYSKIFQEISKVIDYQKESILQISKIFEVVDNLIFGGYSND